MKTKFLAAFLAAFISSVSNAAVTTKSLPLGVSSVTSDFWSKNMGIGESTKAINKTTGEVYKTTNLFCVASTCFVNTTKTGEKVDVSKNSDLATFEVDNLPSPSGGGSNWADAYKGTKWEKEAKEYQDAGESESEYRKIVDEDNTLAQLVRQIEVKKSQQAKESSSGSSSGGSSSGGSSSGGSSSGGSSSGGSSSGGSSSGGSSSGGSSSGGSSSGGSSSGGSSSGGSSSGDSSSGGSGEYVYYSITTLKDTFYGEDKEQLCRSVFSNFKNDFGDSLVEIWVGESGGYKDLCRGYWPRDRWGNANKDYVSIQIHKHVLKEESIEESSECSESGVKQMKSSSGSFSVLCTAKPTPSDDGSPSVSVVGSKTEVSKSSEPEMIGFGFGSIAEALNKVGEKLDNILTAIGGGASNSGAVDGAGGKSDGGASSGDSAGASGGSDKEESVGQSGSGDDAWGTPGKEPSWKDLDSQGDFGSFSKSSVISEVAQCPSNPSLDFGRFGKHDFNLEPLCEAARRLRYVFVSLAYLISALMVYRTVNSFGS